MARLNPRPPPFTKVGLGLKNHDVVYQLALPSAWRVWWARVSGSGPCPPTGSTGSSVRPCLVYTVNISDIRYYFIFSGDRIDNGLTTFSLSKVSPIILGVRREPSVISDYQTLEHLGTPV